MAGSELVHGLNDQGYVMCGKPLEGLIYTSESLGDGITCPKCLQFSAVSRQHFFYLTSDDLGRFSANPKMMVHSICGAQYKPGINYVNLPVCEICVIVDRVNASPMKEHYNG